MLWFILLVIVAGFFIYRFDKKIKTKFEDKFNPHDWELPRNFEASTITQAEPVVADNTVAPRYEKKASALTNTQRTIFNVLSDAIYGEYIILVNVNAADVLRIQSDAHSATVQTAAKNLAKRQFDFLICSKNQLQARCAITLGEKLDPLLAQACEAVQLPLALFHIQTTYDIRVIRESLMQALGVTVLPTANSTESALNIIDEQPQKPILNENPIKIETCPLCSSIMLKRKATNGIVAGKLFWTCAHYPQCRGILPVN